MRRKMTPTGNLTREEWLQLRRKRNRWFRCFCDYRKKFLQEYFTAVGRKKQESCQLQITETNLLTGGM